jgi:diaminohydroxyphosphoribosylaminopyrimidine deaminase/5-amino-6-(5-phosphoribosylamino)uracil reductase
VVAAGIARVVYGVGDPDPRVAGAGVAALTKAGVSVEGPLLVEEISRELSAYLHHRRTGRPEVVLKIAATLDGQIAAVDGSSRWITSGESRRAVHEMRADADVIVVGAGTVRVDNPDLRARDAVSPRDPRRVVLGTVPADARCQPAEAYDGDLSTLLDRLGTDGVLQVVVEGGPRVWESFLRAGLVQKITWFQAPALAGGASNHHVLPGLATTTIDELRRYRLVEVTRIGEDIRLDLEV